MARFPALPDPWPHRPVPPAGERIDIHSSDQSAAITEVGATLASYRAGGVDLLDGFGPEEASSGGRGQPLIPWPNRLGDGRYEFNGEVHQLPLDEPEHQNAIHGLLRYGRWEAVEVSSDHVVMTHLLYPRPGYPFSLGTTLAYRIGPAGIEADVAAVNLGTDPLPLGAGFHPYLCAGTPTVNALRLQVPATERLVLDARGLPSGRVPVTGTDLDYREGREIGAAVLDTAFTGLVRDADGRARVHLDDPSSGRGVTLWVDEAFEYLMCFTGDTLAPAARRRGLAVEPMSCPPNAFQSGEALVRLAPGERFVGRWGISAR